jgi:hypothetical protein
MARSRAPLDFDAELEGFDPAEWDRPGDGSAAPTDRAAAAAGFVSREPVPARPEAPPFVRPRRQGRQTGRNQQLNLKVRPDTLVRFYAIADRQGWCLGETLEHAVDLLEARIAPPARDPGADS